MTERAPDVDVSLSWYELRRLALCAGVAAALDDRLGRSALVVLARLDLQHPELPSLTAAAEKLTAAIGASP